jgi:hypothetical protein
VTGRVDQIDQELVALSFLPICKHCVGISSWGMVAHLRNVFQILLIGEMGIQRDGGGLDGDTSFLLVLSCVGKSTKCMSESTLSSH